MVRVLCLGLNFGGTQELSTPAPLPFWKIVMRFSLILIIAGIVLMSGCSGGSVQSMFVSTPPRIDGDLSEWQKIPVALFDDRKIAMGAMNDGQYLYVAGRCVEEELTRSIKRSGLTVWIDPEGKKSKDLELRYPASRDAQPDQTRGGFWQIMSDDQKKKASEKLDQMKKGVLLIDKHVIDSRVFVPDTAGGFASAIAESNGRRLAHRGTAGKDDQVRAL